MSRQYDEKREVKNFKLYLKHTDFYEVEVPWVRSRLGEYLLKQHPEDHPISILSVGCNEGHKDYELLEALRSRKVHYTAFDASAEMMQEFQKRVVDSKTFPNVNFQLLTTTCEEFVDRENRSTYDLIHILHVVYYVAPLDHYIAKYRSLLSPKGLLVISSYAIDAPIITLRAQKFGLEPHMPDVGAVIKRLGYDHWKETITHHMNIGPWFVTKSPGHAEALMSEVVKDLLIFIVYLDTLENVSPARISEFMESMREVSVQDGCKLLFPLPSDVFFIKP